MNTDSWWPALDLDDPEEPTDVTAAPAEPEVTKEHDGGEWLAGFNRGVTAGRQDVMEALRRVLGDSPVGQDIEARVLEALKTAVAK